MIKETRGNIIRLVNVTDPEYIDVDYPLKQEMTTSRGGQYPLRLPALWNPAAPPVVGSNVRVNVSSTWKNADSVSVRVSGAWKTGTVYVNVGGTWKT